MSEYTFQIQGEDKIAIFSSTTHIIRTKKDFETFYDYLDSTVSEILIPLLDNKDYIQWLKDVLYFNPDYREIELLNNFLTNESFYIQIEEDKFKFLKKYSDLIERKLSFGSNYEHIGIFVDNDSEHKLYGLENKYRSLSKIREELESTFLTQLGLTKTLNEKCEFLKLNLKYFISTSHHNNIIGTAFTNEPRNKDITVQLSSLKTAFNSIAFLFQRKRQFYEKYRKIKEKLVKEKLLPESKEETLSNPQAVLEKLMVEIKKYNMNLIRFLEENEMVIGVETQIGKVIREINNVLEGYNDEG